MRNPLSPPATLIVKLGSALVHAADFLSAGGHEFDKAAFDALMQDADVKQWLADMDAAALLPVKRTKP
jgi:hypothetical protein